MKASTSRILIETFVQKALRDIKDSPERSTRNLVDMALHFSSGRFQKQFLQLASAMLKNDNSPYYRLIEDTVTHTNSDRLLRFGVNLGYNSCTMGAKRIRELKEKEHIRIPWMTALAIRGRSFAAFHERYSQILSQGEALGIYTWFLICLGCLHEELFSLAREHRDSAFVYFCTPEDITAGLADSAADVNNIMFAVQLGEHTAEACECLREAGLLVSIYSLYNESCIDSVLSGECLCSAEQLHPVFSALLPEHGTPEKICEEVYQYVLRVRKEQLFQTLPCDLLRDGSEIDCIISETKTPALVYFDEDGCLFTKQGRAETDSQNLFRSDLKQILMEAFPPESGTTDRDSAAG